MTGGIAILVSVLALGALVAALGSGDDPGRTDGRRAPGAGGGAAAGSTTRAAGGSRTDGAAPVASGEATGAERPAAGGSGPDALGGLAAPGASSHVVKTASVSVQVARRGVDGAFGRVLRTVQGAGGFVVNSRTGPGRAELTLRVPTTAFESTLAAIRGIGKVTDESLRGDDVSAEYVDLEARLRNWRAQEAVLLDLMRQARSIADTITVQQQLSQIQQQIEELEGRRRLLDDQSSFGTVTVMLATAGAAAASPAGASTLGAAWSDAVGVTLAVLGGTIVVLGALLPLALLAGVGGAAWVLVRRRRLPAEQGPSVA
jgi:hypothetical protein